MLDNACTEFADGIALLTRGHYVDSHRRLSDAHDAFLRLDPSGAGADLQHVDLFRTVVMLAAGQAAQLASHPNLQGAQGMLVSWQACRASALGTAAYHRNGGLSQEAFAHYQQAVGLFRQAVPLLEAGLRHRHPDLMGPLGDFSGNLRAVGAEAEAELVYQRVVGLPPSRLSAAMMGGGYPIIVLDPFGTNPLLPSQTPGGFSGAW